MTRWTATGLAAALGLPHPPTPEQAAVIEAPPRPEVVVAGAGSGKTETMAARVVWLVANGYVHPGQVLGLTFTRKAARELSGRIRRRLDLLRLRGLMPEDPGEAGEVSVSTYDAYTQVIVAEHGVRAGREPGLRVAGDAVRWQIATRVVAAYDGPMDAVDLAPATVAGHILALHDELSGHLVPVAAVREFAERLTATIESLPRTARGRATGTHDSASHPAESRARRGRASEPVVDPRGLMTAILPETHVGGEVYAPVRDVLARQRARVQLLPLVELFRAELRRRELTDFAEQAELAAHLAAAFPEIGERERERYGVVLLDEYQDTSHSQLSLLRALFAGHPVTAVGDPCQSIYGWRGASAGTLGSFAAHFADPARAGVPQRTLATSFRNGPQVLVVANRVAEPLREHGLRVPQLAPGPGVARASVEAAIHETVVDEANHLAQRLRAVWDEDAATRAAGADGRTIAVLVRRRAQIPLIRDHLVDAGLPVEVVGVGGLLTVPEVADVVATLRVLSDPGRGDALVRLLTGSRWRMGPRDLDALGRWARHVTRGPVGDPAGSPAAGPAGGPTRADAADGASLVDALDSLPPPGWLSDPGRERARRLGGELRALRRRLGDPVPDLVAAVVSTLGLDVEVMARTGRATARADLEAFAEVASSFVEFGDEPTLPAFLGYLDAAASEERGLDRAEVPVHGRRVQILTVHGAKGLEWDVVAVPGLVQGVFPAGDDAGAWLTDPGLLPYPLRGDADALPAFAWERATDQKQVRTALADFKADVVSRAELEERRLAYVAVTRARSLLLCSGYVWDRTQRPRRPAPFLREILDACAETGQSVLRWGMPAGGTTDGVPASTDRRTAEGAERVSAGDAGQGTTGGIPDVGRVNPLLAAGARSAAWPLDPLDARRRAEIEAGARLVAGSGAGSVPGSPWRREVDLLLAERAAHAGAADPARHGTAGGGLPRVLSASALTALARDPDRFLRSVRRPMPQPPRPYARAGTAFHAWVERYYGRPGLLDVDELPGSADESAPAHPDTGVLREAFLASEWAARGPVEIEAAFELPLGDVVVRGRADAVFASPGGGLVVVDWKTGPPPEDPSDLTVRSVQLAVYRLAFARLHGLALDQVGAAFHHVRENRTIRPVDLLDEPGLRTLLSARTVPAGGPG